MHSLHNSCLLLLLFMFILVRDPENGCNCVLMPENYNRNIRPSADLGVADDIVFDMYVHKVGPIEESKMSVTVDMYYRRYWRDKRLIELFNMIQNVTNNTSDSIALGHDYVALIWVPDIYWVDGLDVEKPGAEDASQSLELTKEGDLFYSSRILIELRCEMKLKLFPFDKQDCNLCFESYLYHDQHQNMTWKSHTVSVSPDQITANFYLENNHETTISKSDYGIGSVWSSLCVKLKLSRKVTIYIVTMFLPSISLVILSFVGFWIDKRATPARSGLSITTILAQITLITGTANKFPGIADLKMGDLYLIVNFFYVFASLIEFALVSYHPQQTQSTMKIVADHIKSANWIKSGARRAKSVMSKGTVGTGKVDIDDSQVLSYRIKFGMTSSFEGNGMPLEPITEEEVKRSESGKEKERTREESDVSLTSKIRKKKEAAAKNDATIPYWSLGNADEISKWFFPLTFLIWNVTYFIINLQMSERI